MFCYDSLCHLESKITPKKLTLVTTTSINNISRLVELRTKYPQAKIGFGIHPWFVNKNNIEELEILITQFKPDFIGEIGLDYLQPHHDLQQQIFSTQLDLAKQFNLPVIIHTVRAYNDVLAILKKHNSRGIIHGFNAQYPIAQEFIKLGFILGIGSNISKNTKISQSLKDIEINKLVFESDAPFMPGFNKTLSFSDDTFLYAQIAAKKLDINLIDLIEQSNKNLLNLFK